jgi:hypothetical protein
METNENLDQKTLALEVTETTKMYLKTTSSWTHFYAILGFISIGICVLTALVMFAINGQMPVGIFFQGYFTTMGILFLIMAGIYVFPALYLLRFSQKTNKALKEGNAHVLEEAFRNMKSYWKFIGIMSIIWIAFAIILIPVMAIASMSMVPAF